MNGVLLMVVAAAVLACGYLGYGRWLANKWGVDKEALTPAKRMKDGNSFSPVSAFTAFSHQFSSIWAYRTKCVSTLGASAQVDAPFSAV